MELCDGDKGSAGGVVRWPEPPRVVFARRFAELYAAAGSPALRVVVSGADSIAEAMYGPGRRSGASVPRVSEWRAGKSVPARFEVFRPVVLALIAMVGKRPDSGSWALHTDVRAWEQLWADSIRRVSTASAGAGGGDAECPYLGLSAYGRGDAGLFFGRDAHVRVVTDLVVAAADSGEDGDAAIVVVLGASGAGKSSLLQAGVVPALARGEVSWRVRTPRLGPHPRQELLDALGAGGEPGGPGAADVADVETDVGAELVIVDQFEELFTVCVDEDERAAFLAELGTVATRAVVVIAVRADFLGRCLDYPVLEEAIARRSHVLGPMRRVDLVDAITKPAEVARHRLDAGLAELVADELCGVGVGARNYGAGALPFLSHAMAAAWQRRAGGRITLAGYRLAGGVAGSVAATAEQAWSTLTPQQQDLASRLLPALVTIGRDCKDTRRVVRRGGLPVQDWRDTETVLAPLAAARLITLDEESVSLTHEVVLDAWPRLRAWLDEDRVGHLERQRLHADADQWDTADRDPSLLYHGTRLAVAEHHAGQRMLSVVAEQFLTASRAQRRRSRQRATGVKAALVVLTAVAVVVAIGAVTQMLRADRDERRAKTESRVAVALRLVQDGEAVLAGDNGSDIHAFQEILAAHTLAATPDTNTAILNTAYQHQPLLENVNINSAIGRMALSPDGLRVVAGSVDHTVLAWDPYTGKEIGRPLTGPTGNLTSVAFSPDGHRLVSGGGDGTVRVWDFDTGAEIGPPLLGHTGAVTGVAFSPDGHRIASGGADHTVRVWDRDTGKGIGLPLTGHTDVVWSVAFSPDGHRIVSGSGDDTVRVWDADTGAEIGSPLTGHTDVVASVAFSPDGHRIASGGSDDTVRVWDADTGAEIGSPLTGHTDWVTSVAFSPDGRRIVSGSVDETVRIWDPGIGAQVGPALTGHTKPVTSVAFSPDGHRVVSGSEHTVRVWDVDTGRQLGPPLIGHTAFAWSVTFSPDGHRMASGGGDGTVRIWDVDTGTEIGPPLICHTDVVASVAFSPDGHRIVSGGGDGTVRIWNADTGSEIGAPLTGHTDALTIAAFSPDGHRIISAGADKTVRIWNADTGAEIGLPLTGHGDGLTSVALSPDRHRMVYGSDDGTIRVWSVDTGAEIGAPLTGHTDVVWSVAFSPDGRRIVSGSVDKTVRIWNADTGAEIGAPLTGHTKPVKSVAFSPDGHRIVSGSLDATARVWDADTGAEIGPPLTGHSNGLTSVAFSPDGRRIASGSYDNTVRVWGAPAGDTIATAIDKICAKIGRNMSKHQWADKIPAEVASYMPSCPNLPIAPDDSE